jgi:hypothetical protein
LFGRHEGQSIEYVAVDETDEQRNEAENYEKLLGALTSPKAPRRDYAKLTHSVFEILCGPLEWPRVHHDPRKSP